MSGAAWQPIDTAGKTDGNLVDVWVVRTLDGHGWRCTDVAWFDGNWRQNVEGDCFDFEPEEGYRFFDNFGPSIPVENSGCTVTHWMPQPSPPVTASLTTPPARSYADGVEDAAQIVEHGYRCSTCAAIFIDTPSDTLNGGHPDNGCASPNWYRLTEEEQAAAIRLLSQGEKA